MFTIRVNHDRSGAANVGRDVFQCDEYSVQQQRDGSLLIATRTYRIGEQPLRNEIPVAMPKIAYVMDSRTGQTVDTIRPTVVTGMAATG